MTEFEWREVPERWSTPTLDLLAKDGGKTVHVGWLLLDGADEGLYEYVHATEEIEYVINLHDVTLEQAKKIVETAVRLKVGV